MGQVRDHTEDTMPEAHKMKSAKHRQTRYQPAPQLDPTVVLEQPPLTKDLEQAKRDLIEYGMEHVLDIIRRNPIGIPINGEDR